MAEGACGEKGTGRGGTERGNLGVGSEETEEAKETEETEETEDFFKDERRSSTCDEDDEESEDAEETEDPPLFAGGSVVAGLQEARKAARTMGKRKRFISLAL